MLRLKSSDPDFAQRFARLVKDRRESDENVSRDVQTIIEDVRLRGDEALAEYTHRFDGHLPEGDGWKIDAATCREAFDALAPDLRAALELAAQRIRAYHEAQMPQDRDYTDAAGVRLGAKWRGRWRRALCARWPRGLSLLAADERHSRQGRRGWPPCRHHADPQGRNQPAGAGRCASGRGR
jgi:hypothetical protein